MIKNAPRPEEVKAVMRSKDYWVFGNEQRGYDLNLFGIRSKDRTANVFNDVIGVMYLESGGWCSFMFPATTDPGLYWRENPSNVEGVAVLAPGQYLGAYRIGSHRGYPALQQHKPVKVFRDNDRDPLLDLRPSTIREGMYRINIHRASPTSASPFVNRWSAGCQVLADPIHFHFLMSLARKSASIFGNSFTYTLLDEGDFGEMGVEV